MKPLMATDLYLNCYKGKQLFPTLVTQSKSISSLKSCPLNPDATELEDVNAFNVIREMSFQKIVRENASTAPITVLVE